MIKQCIVCLRDKKIPKGLRCSSCKCNLRRFRVKEELIRYKGSKCELCGYNKSMRSLTFHHLDPTQKDFNISGSHCRSFKILKNEVDKCQLLCQNCHNEAHEKIDLAQNNISQMRYEFYKNLRKDKPICLTCGIILRSKKQKQCIKCYKLNSKMPPKEQLEQLIWQKPTTHIAKQFGVSDKAVEKWCKKYGIEKPQRGYWMKQSKAA